MEWKIGEIRQVNGEWYQCVGGNGCENCAFKRRKCYLEGDTDDPIGECCYDRRRDNKDVIFKKLEKVGEPFTIVGKLYQYYKVFDIDNVYGDGPWCVYNYKAKTLTIEIKQNKEEDMKTVRISKDDLNFLVNKIRYGILPKHTDWDKITSEITDLFSVEDVILSNSENIGKKLKPFDLEAAKAGKPVCTRDGRKARIICFDRTGKFPIVALVEAKDRDDIYSYLNCGKDNESVEKEYDLMMLPEKKEGWVNVSKFSTYASKEEALSHKTYDIIDTIKVSWEE